MKRIALLRGINVSGKNKIPMTDLKAVCKELGFENVETILQTGNVIFSAKGDNPILESKLEAAIDKSFGLSIPVIVRKTDEFESVINECPFSNAAAENPSRVLLYHTKLPVSKDAADRLSEKATAGEIIVASKGVLWVYFSDGVGKSKLTPAFIDKSVGSAATGRNWNTLVKIQKALAG